MSTIEIASILWRTGAAAIIFSMAFLRFSLLFEPTYRDQAWKPPIVTPGQWKLCIGIMALVEMGVAAAIATVYLSTSFIIYLVLLLGIVLTGYGAISIIKTGDCGCAGGKQAPSFSRKTLSAYLARNALLFGGTVVACLVSPDFWFVTVRSGLSASLWFLVLTVSILPLIIFAWISTAGRVRLRLKERTVRQFN